MRLLTSAILFISLHSYGQVMFGVGGNNMRSPVMEICGEKTFVRGSFMPSTRRVNVNCVYGVGLFHKIKNFELCAGFYHNSTGADSTNWTKPGLSLLYNSNKFYSKVFYSNGILIITLGGFIKIDLND